MKILVAIKRVVDPTFAIHIKPDSTQVNLADAPMILNPYCEVALEEAISLKESAIATEVVAVSIGNDLCHEQLRTALALGADRAIHIQTEQQLEPLIVAKLLSKIVELEQPTLIFTGKQSVDHDNNQTGQMLAGLLNLAQATFASNITFEKDHVLVTREIEQGSQLIQLSLPAVITVDLSLNTPRHASLINVMKAKRKPIETHAANTLGVDLMPRTHTIKMVSLHGQRSAIRVNSVDELLNKLKNDARII